MSIFGGWQIRRDEKSRVYVQLFYPQKLYFVLIRVRVLLNFSPAFIWVKAVQHLRE